jgi:hypothetical protein
MGFKAKQVDRFCKYMEEREQIRIRKEVNGEPWPWTDDKILQKYKFTNVHRSNDRTTRYFALQYKDHWDAAPEVALYNCALYRYFGTMQFMSAVGWMHHHDPGHIKRTVRMMNKNGERVFTGAYIVTNAGRHGPKEDAVIGFLRDLSKNLDVITSTMIANSSWEAGYEQLCEVDGFGGSGFMAKEVLQDWLLWNTRYPIQDGASWTPVGPGGRRGLNRLQGRDLLYRQTEAKFIEECRNLWEAISPWWHQRFESGLTSHDVQFCLCEFDKYERVRLGQGRPRSQYRGAELPSGFVVVESATNSSPSRRRRGAR